MAGKSAAKAAAKAAPAAGRAARASSSADGSAHTKRKARDEEADAPRRKQRKESSGAECVCRRCQQTPAVAKWAKQTTRANGSVMPLGDACLDCKSAWAAGWALQGSFEDIADRCRDDTEVNAQFQESIEVLNGRRGKEYTEADVDSDDSQGVEVSRRFVGLSIAEFQQYFFGCTPKQLGIKLRDLEDNAGEKFKGVIIQDPEAPGVRYKVYRRLGVRQRHNHLARGKHIRADQATATLKFLMNRTETKHSMFKNIRALTFEELATKAKAVKGELEEAANNGDLEAFASGSEAGEDDKVEVQDLVHAPTLSAMPAPTTATPRRKGAMSVVGAGDGTSDRLTRKGSTIFSDNDSVGDGIDGMPSWMAKIAKYDIAKILGGERMGRERRRLREALTEREGKKECEAEVVQMREHLERGMRAETISPPATVYNVDMAVLRPMIQDLKNAKVDFPTVMKEALVGKACKEFSEALVKPGTAEIEALVETIEPWPRYDTPDPGSEDPAFDGAMRTPVPFDPMAPKLSATEGSDIGKSALFVELFLKHALGPLVKLIGNSSTSDVVLKLTYIQNRWTTLEDDVVPDECFDAVVKLLVCIRAGLCLVDANSSIEFWDDFLEVVEPIVRRSLKEPSAHFLAALKAHSPAKTLLDELRPYQNGTKKHHKALLAMKEKLQDPENMTLKEGIAIAKDMMLFMQEMRPGAVDATMEMFGKAVDRKSIELRISMNEFDESGGKSPGIDHWDDHKLFWTELLRFSTVKHDWRVSLSLVNEVLPKIRCAADKDLFMDALKQFDSEILTTADATTELAKMSERFELHVKPGMGVAELEKVSVLVKDGFERAVRAVFDLEQVDAATLESILQLLQAWVWVIAKPSALLRIVPFLKLVYDLMQLRAKMESYFGDKLVELVGERDGSEMLGGAMSMTMELFEQSKVLEENGYTWKFAAGLSNEVTDKFVTPGKEAAILMSWSALEHKVTSSAFHEIAGGVPDGTMWYETLAEGAGLAQIIDRARETVLTIKAVERKRLVDDIHSKTMVYQNSLKFYKIDDDPKVESFQKIQESLRRARAVQYAGVLAFTYVKHKTDMARMKRGCGDAEKSIQREGLEALVPRPLMEMAATARALMRV